MTQNDDTSAKKPGDPAEKPAAKAPDQSPAKPLPKEYGGPTGPEPTRYGDWERNGKVSDF